MLTTNGGSKSQKILIARDKLKTGILTKGWQANNI